MVLDILRRIPFVGDNIEISYDAASPTDNIMNVCLFVVVIVVRVSVCM